MMRMFYAYTIQYGSQLPHIVIVHLKSGQYKNLNFKFKYLHIASGYTTVLGSAAPGDFIRFFPLL